VVEFQSCNYFEFLTYKLLEVFLIIFSSQAVVLPLFLAQWTFPLIQIFTQSIMVVVVSHHIHIGFSWKISDHSVKYVCKQCEDYF